MLGGVRDIATVPRPRDRGRPPLEGCRLHPFSYGAGHGSARFHTRNRGLIERTSIKVKAVIALAVVLGLGSIAAVTMLEIRADGSRAAQLRLEQLNTEVNVLQATPWQGDPVDGASPARALASMRETEQR